MTNKFRLYEYLLVLLNTISLLVITDASPKVYDVVYSINQQKYYVIKEPFYYEIHGMVTLEVLLSGRTPANQDFWGLPTYYNHNISDISVLNDAYSLGDSYPTLVLADTSLAPQSSNELNTVNMATLNYIFYGDKSLLNDLYDIPYHKIGLPKLLNSAMIPVDGSYLCIHRNGFFWLDNKFKLDLSNSKAIPGIIPSKINEEDHRLLTLPNGDIITIFNAIIDPENNAVNKVGYRYLQKKIIHNQSNFSISEQIILYKDDIKASLKSSYEKNWSPFNYKDNQIFLIQSFQPFIVYNLDITTTTNIQKLQYHFDDSSIDSINYKAKSVELVSQVDCPAFATYFGRIRGGSPATLVRGEYLGFYHTYESGQGHLASILPNNHFFYFIGAYTFTADPPFKMTSFSRFPISHDSFVPAIYKPGKPPALVTYVTSYVLIDKDGNVIPEGVNEPNPDSTTLVLTIGVRDLHTIVAKINLNELYDSLKPIVC